MERALNAVRLSDLLDKLHRITGYRLSLHAPDGTELYSCKLRTAFCDLICDTQDGYQRCLTCDRRAITSFAQLLRPIQYRCHAGLVDTAIPVLEGDRIVAVILFGQILDDSPIEKQWANAQKKCAWYHDMRALQRAFFEVPHLGTQDIQACIDVLNACVGNMRLLGGPDAAPQTDAQRLKMYISIHYSSPLTLDSVARALSISKSKLCQMAAGIEPGMTVSKMIAQRRVNMAKHLLSHSNAPVRDIAGRVGIPDYNYFTKVFKSVEGTTPTGYRQRARSPAQRPVKARDILFKGGMLDAGDYE